MAAIAAQPFIVQASKEKQDIGGSLVQQDNGARAEITGSDGSKAVVVAVFDGHGAQRGAQFSQICKDTLEFFLAQEQHFKDRFDANPEETGCQIFAKMHEECFKHNKRHLELSGVEFEERDGLLHVQNIRRIQGGTTATLVFVTDKGMVHCFNVGDSDAWFINQQAATQLNGNHSPDCESEYERIRAQWPETEIVFDYNPRCGVEQRPDGNHVFPKRVGFVGYYRKNVSGDMATLVKVNHPMGNSQLAMTRSIGDEPLRHGGIIPVPAYHCLQATSNTVIKIASDGYWDSIYNTSILQNTQCELRKCGYNADALCQEWFQKSESAARECFGSSRDNMWGYVITLAKNN